MPYGDCVELQLGELPPRGDAQPRVDLPEVVLHGPRAQEEVSCHVSVGQTRGHERDDLELLRSQLLLRPDVRALPRLAGGAQLGLGPRLPRHRPEPLELVTGTPQMRTRVDPATSTAQVLAVQQFGPGLVPRTARPAVERQSVLEPVTDLR